MSLLLKIVEGPNKGAEAALVEGVAVTLGKDDDCDIVLADSTLPGEPVRLEVSGGEVSVDGTPLASFTVKTVGATSFAVGPAEAPWGELRWPEREEEKSEAKGEGREAEDASSAVSPSPSPEKEPPAATGEKKHRGGCLGCLVALVLLLVAAVCLAWLFRDRPQVAAAREKVVKLLHARGEPSAVAAPPSATAAATLRSVAERHGLLLQETNGTTRVYGNFKTRAERLCATAEAYAVHPGVELDLSDDESLRTAAEDSLFTLTEGALKVSVATNRVVALSGASPSPFALKKILEALNSDMPKLAGLDVSGVVFGDSANVPGAEEAETADAGRESSMFAPAVKRRMPRKHAKAAAPELPVCGILTTPYPCLVMKNGARLLEGATVGGSVILKIEADSVTVTNSMGRFTVRP